MRVTRRKRPPVSNTISGAVRQSSIAHQNRPCADRGLISYRLLGRYGYIMIGARDHEDAMREAARSTTNPDRNELEVWNGDQYVKAFPASSASSRT